MEHIEYLKYIQDKRRNKDKRTLVFLGYFRTLCCKKGIIRKLFTKIDIEFFKTTDVYIDSKSIGGWLRMPHLNGIIVHPNASLDENCTIFQQVTIGANEHKLDYKKAPQIGNRVYIGAGAKNIDDITIGDDVRIGANAVITKNIPAGKIVVGFNKIKDSIAERKGII